MRKYRQRTNLDDLDINMQFPEELDEEAIAKLYMRWALKPFDWAHYFFPHFFTKRTPRFHEEIGDNFQFNPTKLQAYEAPRGSAKSTIFEFLGFHQAIFRQIPFVMFISLTEEIAAQRLESIKHEIEHNKLFKLFFGDLRTEKWGEKEFIIKNEANDIHCKFLARGLGQQVLGIKYLENRPALIVVDDAEDIKIAENPRNVDKNERWLTKEVIPSLSDDGRVIMIGTPVTADCLIERVRKRRFSYSRVYSGITPEGLPLWKEWKTIRQLHVLKEELAEAGQLYIYYTEYLCHPLPPDRHPIQEKMIKYYKPKDIDLKKGSFNVYIIVDLAVGQKKRNCFSALVVIAVDEQDVWWVLDTYQTKDDWYYFAKDFYGYRDKWNPIACGVEASAMGAGFFSVLELVAQKHGYKRIYPIAIYPDKDKDIRLRRLLPKFRVKAIKFLRNQLKLIEQLLLHPDSRFEDLKDCLSHGATFCYPPGASQPEEQKQVSWKQGRADTDRELDDEYEEQKRDEGIEMEEWD